MDAALVVSAAPRHFHCHRFLSLAPSLSLSSFSVISTVPIVGVFRIAVTRIVPHRFYPYGPSSLSFPLSLAPSLIVVILNLIQDLYSPSAPIVPYLVRDAARS